MLCTHLAKPVAVIFKQEPSVRQRLKLPMYTEPGAWSAMHAMAYADLPCCQLKPGTEKGQSSLPT